MNLIEVAEYGTVSVSLNDAAGRAVARSGVVEATPDPYLPGQWRIKAKGKVGVATVRTPDAPATTVRIVPKVPVARLLFLLGYHRNPHGWRNEDAQLAAAPDLLPALARLFTRQAERALSQGLLQGYRAVKETSLLVRGRIRDADQIRRRYGKLLPVEVAHDEYTTDIPENQLLRTACERLFRLPGGVPDDVRGVLRRLRARLADVTPIGRGRTLPQWQPSRLNARYHKALRLAELVLRGTSVEHLPGSITVNGFLFDMAKVFEDFVTVALREALAGSGGWCVLQASHYLDERDVVRMVPDFVRYADDGTPLAVVDAKYKAEKPEGFPDADLYQMLAYCTALSLREGHLVYAKGNAPHTTHRVRNAGVVIHQHMLELNQSPADLLSDIQALAERLGAEVLA